VFPRRRSDGALPRSPVLALALLFPGGPTPGAYASHTESPGQCCTVTIRVRVPEGTGTVYLAGSLPELGPWRPDAVALAGEGRERTGEVTAPPGTALEYKFTLGSWDREALSSAGTVAPNNRLLLHRDTLVVHEIDGFKKDPREYIADWRGSGVQGRLVYWPDVPSAFLGPTRHVEIWLPPGYDDAAATRYPVLYMHDGQNLFDPRIANTGVDWGVDEAVARLVNRGIIPPIIVVGVWSTTARFSEYSPWHDAPKYGRFLIEELMPRVNATFRTLTGPGNTAVMGSSMGGLLSFYLVTHHPETFGACGCESTLFPSRKRSSRKSSPASPCLPPRILLPTSSGTFGPASRLRWLRDTASTSAAWNSTPPTRPVTKRSAGGSSRRDASKAGTS